MPQLLFKNVAAPNLTGTANILKQASDQLTGALSGGAKILDDYTKGQQTKADGKVVAEIAKLSTEDEINNFLSSDTVQGKPLSPAMQEAVLGLRKNLLGLQADRANIDATRTNTDGTKQRNEFIGLEGELLGGKVAGQLQSNRLLGGQADAIGIDNQSLAERNDLKIRQGEAGIGQTLASTGLTEQQALAAGIDNDTRGQKNNLGLAQQVASIGQTEASTGLTSEQARAAGITNLTLGQKNLLGLEEQKSGINATDANTLLTAARGDNQNIVNQTQLLRDVTGIRKDQSAVRSNDAGTALKKANTEGVITDNQTRGVRNRADIDAVLANTLGTQARTKLTGTQSETAEINNRTLDQRNQSEIAGIQSRTAGTKASTLLTGEQAKAANIENQFLPTSLQADIRRTNALTTATNTETQVARSSEARTKERFINSQTDRRTALAETAENKQKARVRDDAALSAFQDPNNISDSDVAKSLASSGQFKRPDGTTDSTAIFNAINRAKGLSATGAGAILAPYVQPDATIENAVTLAGLDSEEGIRSSTQGRLLNDAKSYVSDPAGKLTEEFGIVREIFNTPKESKDELRRALNRVASETGVSVDKVAVAFRESFQSSAPWFSTNDPSNIFDIDAAKDYVNTYLSPDAVARHNEYKVVTRSAQQSLEKKQTALTRVEKQIAKSGDQVPASLLLKKEELMREIFSGSGDTPPTTPEEAVDRFAGSVRGPTPTDLEQAQPYEPLYADDGAADYVQQLLLEEARKAGVVQ